MNRTEFEALRDFPDKRIEGEIKFSQRRATQPNLVAEDIRIDNSTGSDLRMMVSYNPEVGCTSINVHLPGTGPICRLDIDGPKHRPAGRCHKHSVQGERCPNRNLPDGVINRDELSGCSVQEIFTTFCSDAHIDFAGEFHAPDGPPTASADEGEDGGQTTAQIALPASNPGDEP